MGVWDILCVRVLRSLVRGRMLAARISEKSVAFYGGIIFLLFGLHSLFLEE